MHFASMALVAFSLLAAANETPSTIPGLIPTPTPSPDLDSDPFAFPTPAPQLKVDDSAQDDELKKRQAPGQVVGAGVPNSPDPTQMSPITTFMKYGPDGKQTPVVYTQTFADVPEQWAPPKSGSIGLGTISGQIGVVKTKVRRNYVAEATAAIKRSVHVLEKRKKKGGSGGGNAASGVTVPLLTVVMALGTGILAVFL